MAAPSRARPDSQKSHHSFAPSGIDLTLPKAIKVLIWNVVGFVSVPWIEGRMIVGDLQRS